jgi:hypothetical protein
MAAVAFGEGWLTPPNSNVLRDNRRMLKWPGMSCACWFVRDPPQSSHDPCSGRGKRLKYFPLTVRIHMWYHLNPPPPLRGGSYATAKTVPRIIGDSKGFQLAPFGRGRKAANPLKDLYDRRYRTVA